MSDRLVDVEVVEQLTDAIVARLDALQMEREGWVTADAVARHLSVEREWVYDHAGMLGGVRLGQGAKGRLRFRLVNVDAAVACVPDRVSPGGQTPAVKPKPPRRRRPPLGTSPPLLPIRGQGER